MREKYYFFFHNLIVRNKGQVIRKDKSDFAKIQNDVLS